MTCLRLAIWPASTPRTPGVAFSDATRSGIPPCGGACASASRAPGLKIAAASAAAKTLTNEAAIAESEACVFHEGQSDAPSRAAHVPDVTLAIHDFRHPRGGD